MLITLGSALRCPAVLVTLMMMISLDELITLASDVSGQFIGWNIQKTHL